MDPKAASAHYPLSLAYNGLGDTKKARSTFACGATIRSSRPIR